MNVDLDVIGVNGGGTGNDNGEMSNMDMERGRINAPMKENGNGNRRMKREDEASSNDHHLLGGGDDHHQHHTRFLHKNSGDKGRDGTAIVKNEKEGMSTTESHVYNTSSTFVQRSVDRDRDVKPESEIRNGGKLQATESGNNRNLKDDNNHQDNNDNSNDNCLVEGSHLKAGNADGNDDNGDSDSDDDVIIVGVRNSSGTDTNANTSRRRLSPSAQGGTGE